MPLTPVVDAPTEALREQAWALKRACYEVWTSDPQQAVQAAQALRQLAAQAREAPDALGLEVAALADWTEGIAHLTQGRLEAGCQALDRAAQGFGRLGQALHAAETQVPKIMGLTLLGRYDEAARCGEDAERAFVVHGHLLAAAKVSLNLGSLHLRRDAQAEAAHHYRAAAVRFARAGNHEHSVMADIGLADALTAQGRLAEAERILARARGRAAAHELPVLEAMADESAALLALVCGRYPDALAGFERSRRTYERLQMPQHRAVAEKQLADAYLELRLLPEALALYGPAVQRFGELAMPTEQAWALTQQGRALALSGRVAQAGAALERAGALFAAQQVPSGLASVALARAELALAAADGAAAALQLADAAWRDFDGAGLLEGRLRAQGLRGRALLAMGRLPEADAAFDALRHEAGALQLLTLQVLAATGRARVAEEDGRTDFARQWYEQAVALTETQRGALPGDELRSAFLADHLAPYQGLLRLALAGGQPHEVLQRLDAFRARALADRLQQGAAARTPGGAPLADDPTRARLSWLYRREQRARDEGEDTAALNARVRELEHELLERERRRRLADGTAAVDTPAVAALAGPDARLDADELCRSLGDGQVLVAYGVEGDELFACVVDARGVQLHRQMASWAEVQQALRSLRFQLDTLRVGAGQVAAHLPLLTRRALLRLQQVHALVWAPLAPRLADAQRVLVVPQGPLAAVPFAALHDGTEPLVARHELAMAPSVRVALHGLRRTPRAARRVLAFGYAPQLPHVATEAARVAARFPDGRAYIGDAATLSALSGQATNADLLHLACHARFRGDNPMFSALHLADGALTAEAVERLQLPACTVVLSACDTALAAPDAGDDRVGLVRAFFVAGAARVLASLWPVDDALTEVFMQRLHAALAAGRAPAEALRAAQLALLREQPHPCHWAAFTLHGGW
ncbi:MAG: CHAT domain-containing protein [Rubrivivax sp.]